MTEGDVVWFALNEAAVRVRCTRTIDMSINCTAASCAPAGALIIAARTPASSPANAAIVAGRIRAEGDQVDRAMGNANDPFVKPFLLFSRLSWEDQRLVHELLDGQTAHASRRMQLRQRRHGSSR